MSPERAPHPASGFSLLEVVFAVALGALALSAVLGSAAGGLRGTDDARGHLLATRVAQSRLAELGRAGPLAAGVRESLIDGHAVRETVTPAGPAIPLQTGEAGRAGIRLYRLEVEARWTSGGRSRAVRLATLRLATSGLGGADAP